MASVAPLVGAWIETCNSYLRCRLAQSLPSWERGLKPKEIIYIYIARQVAPLVGAWIETTKKCYARALHKQVAPLVGAWIETISPL